MIQWKAQSYVAGVLLLQLARSSTSYVLTGRSNDEINSVVLTIIRLHVEYLHVDLRVCHKLLSNFEIFLKLFFLIFKKFNNYNYLLLVLLATHHSHPKCIRGEEPPHPRSHFHCRHYCHSQNHHHHY